MAWYARRATTLPQTPGDRYGGIEFDRLDELHSTTKDDLHWCSLVWSGGDIDGDTLVSRYPWTDDEPVEDDAWGVPDIARPKERADRLKLVRYRHRNPITHERYMTLNVGSARMANLPDETVAFAGAYRAVLSMIRAAKFNLVVYHTADDPVSMCAGNHYHIVLGIERAGGGAARAKSWTGWYPYRHATAANQGSYSRSMWPEGDCPSVTGQTVHSLPGIVKYLSTPPRQFVGTNEELIRAAIDRARINADGRRAESTAAANIREFVGRQRDAAQEPPRRAVRDLAELGAGPDPWGVPDCPRSPSPDPAAKRSRLAWD